jgi:broad specificity phosphatase PhoE
LLDVEAEEPDSIKTWLSDVNAAPHGGESIARVLQRIATWLDRRIGDDGHGIAVTHAAVVRGPFFTPSARRHSRSGTSTSVP